MSTCVCGRGSSSTTTAIRTARSWAALRGRVYAERDIDESALLDEETLRNALVVRRRRVLRRDSTLCVSGTDFELVQSFVRPGKKITVAHCLLDRPPRPWVEYEDKRLELVPVDATANAKRGRKRAKKTPASSSVAFDPATALLDAATHRAPYHHTEKTS